LLSNIGVNTHVNIDSHIASTANPHSVTKAQVGLGSVDNTSDANKPVSTAQQTALDLKANLASPTFTGTVSGITKSMVGLGNVDNTSDLAKPISTATQTALDLKQDASSAVTLTGVQTLTNKTLTSPVINSPTGIVKADVGLANVDNTSDLNKPVSTATQTALNLKEDTANKGVPSGYASLNGAGQVPVSQIPTTIFTYLGAWNATTNTPTLADGIGTNKDQYIVSVPGTQNLGSGPQTFALGDYVIYNGSVWERIPNTDAVSSVAGKIGVVILDKNDVGLSNVDNTSDANKPVSTAQQTAINLKENSANKTTNFTGNTGSNILFPTVKAIFDALVGYLAAYQPLLGYTPANDALSNLTGTSINQTLLPDTDGVYDIGASGQNWNNIRAKTIGYDGGTAINLDSKMMFDGANEESIDFEARLLKDSASLTSVQYDTRALLDIAGTESVNWQSRYLADDSEVLALDYIDRRLFANDGSTPVIDWSSTAGATATTQSPGDNSTKIATTAYVDNIAPTWEEFFGSGTNGNLTLSGPLTLTQDVFYNTLTLNAGAALTTAGYRIFCKTLNLSNAPANAIRRSGSNGNSTITQAGAGLIGALASATLGGSANGGAGATGTTGVGAQAGASGTLVNANGGGSGAGGQGGAGTPNAGGASRAASTATTGVEFNRIAYDILRGQVLISGGAGAPGGSAGGGDGVNNGRGGGGGGAGGGIIAIYAQNIITSASTASGVIVCNGGNGGNGANGGAGNVGGGGGGAGAGGGYVYIMYANKTGPTITNLITANGGTGGNAGNGFGTGLGGRGGGGGTGGAIELFNISTSTGSRTVGAAGGTGGLNVGITGGTGGAAGICNVSL
jgi:hypothetical protein